VYPANKVWPSADHASDKQTGAFVVLPITSGFSSSTTILPSKSYNMSTNKISQREKYPLDVHRIVAETIARKFVQFNILRADITLK